MAISENDFIENKTEITLGEQEQLNLKQAREYLGLTRYSIEPTLKRFGIHISKPINQRGKYILKKDLDRVRELLRENDKMTKEMTK